MVPGEQIRLKETFSLFSWSMSTGVSSLDFPILNFKAFVKKKKRERESEKEREKTKLGTWKI